MATLLPAATQARHRVLVQALQRWLAHGWVWFRPRSVPMLVAFAGFLAVLGATKYLSVYACGDGMTIRAPAEAPGAPAHDPRVDGPAMSGFITPHTPLWPAATCGALVPTLLDNWPGHRRHLQRHARAGSPLERTLHQPDGCSPAPVRLR